MKKYTKANQISFIREMITTNKQWAQKALLTIFENQTEDEKVIRETKHDNGIGFNSSDANTLSFLANELQTYGHLAEYKMPYLYKKIGKYAGQLYTVSDKEKLIKIMEKRNQPEPVKTEQQTMEI